LEKEFGEHVAEQRGCHWAMKSFGVDVYKASEKDLMVEGIDSE
jgi:hypothetical protein